MFNTVKGSRPSTKKQETWNDQLSPRDGSITHSPIRHVVLAGKKNLSKNIHLKNPAFWTEQERLGQLYGDRSEIEKQETKFDIHNAQGEFICKCKIC